MSDTSIDQTPRYLDPCSELREEIKQLHNRIGEKDQEIGAQRSEINHLQIPTDDPKEPHGKRRAIWQLRQLISRLVIEMYDEGEDNLEIAIALRINCGLVDEIVEYYRETKTRRTVYLERSD